MGNGKIEEDNRDSFQTANEDNLSKYSVVANLSDQSTWLSGCAEMEHYVWSDSTLVRFA